MAGIIGDGMSGICTICGKAGGFPIMSFLPVDIMGMGRWTRKYTAFIDYLFLCATKFLMCVHDYDILV
jgi:hypothetical protein